MWHTCELVWGPEMLAAVHDLIRSATGRECPCRRGERSPFLPPRYYHGNGEPCRKRVAA